MRDSILSECVIRRIIPVPQKKIES